MPITQARMIALLNTTTRALQVISSTRKDLRELKESCGAPYGSGAPCGASDSSGAASALSRRIGEILDEMETTDEDLRTYYTELAWFKAAKKRNERHLESQKRHRAEQL